MPPPTQIRRVIVPILLIVLVLAATTGMAWHQHHDQCCTANCTLCHLSLAPPPASAGVIGAIPAESVYVVRAESFVSRTRSHEKPPRAPPV
jgi:hypothetical protein